MSIEHVENGNLFACEAEGIVNAVNCLGAMGKGIAEQFKNRFPENFKAYRLMCDKRLLKPGHMFVFDQASVSGLLPGPKWIVNLATKDDWRNPSEIDWIRDGAMRLRQWADANGVASIACPALGTGNGQLKWSEVRSILEAAFDGAGTRLVLFAPQEHLNSTPTRRWSPR